MVRVLGSAEAAALGILVPALIEDVRPPLAFPRIEAARLCDWRGEVDNREFQQLLGTISRLVGARAITRRASAARTRARTAGAIVEIRLPSAPRKANRIQRSSATEKC